MRVFGWILAVLFFGGMAPVLVWLSAVIIGAHPLPADNGPVDAFNYFGFIGCICTMTAGCVMLFLSTLLEQPIKLLRGKFY